MSLMLLRWGSALVLTYALSRALLRAPVPGRGPVRLVLVHGLSAVAIGGWAAWLRQSADAAIAPVVLQAMWWGLDRARCRERDVKVTARTA